MEIEFKYELGSFVVAKPFYQKGKLIIPPATERYKVIGRMYTEGIIPDTNRTASAVVYHVKLSQALFAKDRDLIRTVQEKDILPVGSLIATNDLGTAQD